MIISQSFRAANFFLSVLSVSSLKKLILPKLGFYLGRKFTVLNRVSAPYGLWTRNGPQESSPAWDSTEVRCTQLHCAAHLLCSNLLCSPPCCCVMSVSTLAAELVPLHCPWGWGSATSISADNLGALGEWRFEAYSKGLSWKQRPMTAKHCPNPVLRSRASSRVIQSWCHILLLQSLLCACSLGNISLLLKREEINYEGSPNYTKNGHINLFNITCKLWMSVMNHRCS